jgi:hypothetical protein
VGVCTCGWFDNCMGVLVISVLVFTVVLYYFYCAFLLFCLCIFILSALLPPNENSVAVNNNKRQGLVLCLFKYIKKYLGSIGDKCNDKLFSYVNICLSTMALF